MRHPRDHICVFAAAEDGLQAAGRAEETQRWTWRKRRENPTTGAGAQEPEEHVTTKQLTDHVIKSTQLFYYDFMDVFLNLIMLFKMDVIFEVLVLTKNEITVIIYSLPWWYLYRGIDVLELCSIQMACWWVNDEFSDFGELIL